MASSLHLIHITSIPATGPPELCLMFADFILNLAAGLTQTFLTAVATRLQGDPQRKALERVYEDGFARWLDSLRRELSNGEIAVVAEAFQPFLREADVSTELLDMALSGQPPDIDRLARRLGHVGGDEQLVNIRFDTPRQLRALQRYLTIALANEAGRAESPLFNRVTLARLLAVHGLLENEQRSYDEMLEILRQLESRDAETVHNVYNIVIENAANLAIGDQAQVVQSLSAELREILAEILESVRRNAPALDFTPDDVTIYLDSIIRQCATLALQVGPLSSLPLERVYVALRADRAGSAERRANETLWKEDLAAWEMSEGVQMSDERERQRLLRLLVAGRDPRGLTLQAMAHAAGRSDAQGDLPNDARIDAGALVARERRAVLLGDPGAGKSTLLRWIALRFAQALRAGETRVRVAAVEVQGERPSQEADESPRGGLLDLGLLDLGPVRLPVLVRLADYAAARFVYDPKNNSIDNGLSLADYLGQDGWFGDPLHPEPRIAQAIVQACLRGGRTLVLLDGLDEIAERDRRTQVVEAIEAFLEHFVIAPQSDDDFIVPAAGTSMTEKPMTWGGTTPQQRGGNQVLITSRPIGYYLAPLSAELPHFVVDELSPAAISQFCHAWCTAVAGEARDRDAAVDGDALTAAVLDEARPSTRELAANPLLLTILAGLFYTLKGRLPERRFVLYQEAVRAILRQRWDEWRTLEMVKGDDFVDEEGSDDPFHFVIGYVAAHLFTHANALAEEEEMVALLANGLRQYFGAVRRRDARRLARNLLVTCRDQGGLLLERGDGIYGFLHRTFLEYFAAVYLTWDEAQAPAELAARLDDPAWREVLLLGVAAVGEGQPEMTDALLLALLDAPEPAGDLIPRNGLFGAAALAELRPDRVSNDVTGRIFAALVRGYREPVWPAQQGLETAEPLRAAIERAVTRLHDHPGWIAAAAAGVGYPEERDRLAVGGLILATGWWRAELIAPLQQSLCDFAAPFMTPGLALAHLYQEMPDAFESTYPWLADRAASGARLAADPDWRTILTLLYANPGNLSLEIPPPILATPLTPIVVEAWRAGVAGQALLATVAAAADDPTC
ncbi:MAG: hypothetical protein H6642_09690, partial [Caldilineaceae bacterium]|nr:hypothetical protein [Caldilineaceae bacterium]